MTVQSPSATPTIAPAHFEPPNPNDTNIELWLLRAPVHLDVMSLLNGNILTVDTVGGSMRATMRMSSPRDNDDGASSSMSTSHYALSSCDGYYHPRDMDGMRLLVPERTTNSPHRRGGAKRGGGDVDVDDDDSSSSSSSSNENDIGIKKKKRKKRKTTTMLIPHVPFDRHVQLTSSGPTTSASESAPSIEDAPPPALGGDVDNARNGIVDKVRYAYDVVPQRGGMRRRWNMPGGAGGGCGIVPSCSSSTTSTTNAGRRGVGEDDDDDDRNDDGNRVRKKKKNKDRREKGKQRRG
jgi:hypothetical protein